MILLTTSMIMRSCNFYQDIGSMCFIKDWHFANVKFCKLNNICAQKIWKKIWFNYLWSMYLILRLLIWNDYGTKSTYWWIVYWRRVLVILQRNIACTRHIVQLFSKFIMGLPVRTFKLRPLHVDLHPPHG